MPTAPTEKEREIEQLDDIIDALDDGYLRSILTSARPEIVRAIGSDFGCLDLSHLLARLRELEQRTETELTQLAEAHKQLAEVNRLKAQAESQLEDMAKTAAVVHSHLQQWKFSK